MEDHGLDFNVEQMRDKTLRELERLVEQRRELDKRISGLRVALNGFTATIRAQRNEYEMEPLPLDPEYEGIREMGLTNAVRRILEHAIGGMTPRDVRSKLQDLKYKRLPATNPLAALHAIFSRLAKAGEIEPTLPDHKAYRWISEIERLSRAVPPPRKLSRHQRY